MSLLHSKTQSLRIVLVTPIFSAVHEGQEKQVRQEFSAKHLIARIFKQKGSRVVPVNPVFPLLKELHMICKNSMLHQTMVLKLSEI